MRVSAEAAVIAGLIADPALLARVDLRADEFEAPAFRAAYQAITALAIHGRPIDVVTVMDYLDSTTFVPAVHAAYGEGVASANVPAYAEIVRRKSMCRRGVEIAERLTARLQDEDADAVGEAVAALVDLTAGRRQHEFGLKQVLESAVERIEAASERGTAVEITTGLVDLDDCLGGWHAGDLTIVGARPAMGKTALMLNCAERAARAGHPVGVLSAEQGADQVGLRLVSAQRGVTLHDLRTARLAESAWGQITGALAKLNGLPVWVYDRSRPDLAEVVSLVRKWRLQHGVQVVFLDYVQRIAHPDRDMRPDRQVWDIAVSLKALARDLGIAVVALAQVNRAVEARQNKRPTMADLKESGGLEQEADQVLMLYRDEVYHPESDDKGIAEIIVEKNRHGPLGLIKTAWVGEHVWFGDLAKREFQNRYARTA